MIGKVVHMVKKSQIKEIIDYAIHADGITGYTILYRDFNEFKEITLEEWLELSKVDSIPNHRIATIKKNNKIIFQRPIVR